MIRVIDDCDKTRVAKSPKDDSGALRKKRPASATSCRPKDLQADPRDMLTDPDRWVPNPQSQAGDMHVFDLGLLGPFPFSGPNIFHFCL